MILETCITVNDLIDKLLVAKDHCVNGNSKLKVCINDPEYFSCKSTTRYKNVNVDIQFDNKTIEFVID